MGAELTPWWVALGTGVVSALAGVIGKLWAAHMAEVKALRAELATARAELDAANKRNVELQQQTSHEHVKDLRRIAGLAASWPPAVIDRRR